MDCALSGAAALTIMAAAEVDVIVTDFRMPEMNGGQLLAVVRERNPSTVRLILSGDSGQDDSLTATDLVQQYLTKPCSPEDLVFAIETALFLKPDD